MLICGGDHLLQKLDNAVLAGYLRKRVTEENGTGITNDRTRGN